jgi:hypothetical protein
LTARTSSTQALCRGAGGSGDVALDEITAKGEEVQDSEPINPVTKAPDLCSSKQDMTNRI